MGDAPATKKELAALQKQVNELSRDYLNDIKTAFAQIRDLGDKLTSVAKELDVEKKFTLDITGQIVKAFNEEKKVVHGEIDSLEKSTNKTFEERKKWFDDEKKVVHDQLDGLEKRFNDEKKSMRDELDKLKKWVQDELTKLKK